MAISSAIAMLAFADLGVGNGLVNAISNASGRDNHQEIKKYISSATIVLCVVGLTIFLVFYGLYSHIKWASLFHLTSPEAIDEAGPAALICVIVFALNLPIGMVQRVQMGLQMGFLSNFWQILSSLFTLGAVLLVVHLKLGLPLLVLAQAGMPVAIGLINGILFFVLYITIEWQQASSTAWVGHEILGPHEYAGDLVFADSRTLYQFTAIPVFKCVDIQFVQHTLKVQQREQTTFWKVDITYVVCDHPVVCVVFKDVFVHVDIYGKRPERLDFEISQQSQILTPGFSEISIHRSLVTRA